MNMRCCKRFYAVLRDSYTDGAVFRNAGQNAIATQDDSGPLRLTTRPDTVVLRLPSLITQVS